MYIFHILSTSFPHRFFIVLYAHPAHSAQLQHLRGGVTTVDPQFSSSHVCGGVTEEEDNSTHQVLGTTHLSLWDQGCPLTVEVRVAVDDLLCAIDMSVRNTMA